MKISLKYLFLFTSFLLVATTVAQNSQLRAYSIEDGLPQSQVYAMVQDDIGYLWAGTQGGGLAKFDGRQFEVLNESDGLLSNYVHSLHFQNDSLFIGTRKGLSLRVNGDFRNFIAPQVQQFYPFEKNLYLATEKGIHLFSKTEKLKKINIDPEIDASAINCIFFDGAYTWLATTHGLWKLSGLPHSSTEIMKLKSGNFRAVLAHQDKIIAATFDDGVHIMDIKNPDKDFLMREPSRINSMSIKNADELWIATDSEGVIVVNTKTFEEIKTLNTTSGLAVPHVREIIADSSNNLWIATSGGGFYKYAPNNFVHYNRKSGLEGNRIYAVHAAQDGLWISNSENGLAKIDSAGIHPIESAGNFANVKIKTITSDANGNVWAGSDDRGILFRETKMMDSVVLSIGDAFQIQMDTITKKTIENHIINEKKGFPSDWIRKIVITDGAVWAATYASGIVKFNYFPDQDSLIVYKIFGKQDGLSDLLVNDFVTDTDGRLWYATNNGYLGYIQNDTVTAITTPLEQQTSIRSLLFQGDRLVLGTSGMGVWHANRNDIGNIQKLQGAKELSSKNIYQLIYDDQGYLWAGSERGVDKIELNQANELVDVQHFGRNDGFLGIETCLNAVAKDNEGNLWFGALYGLTKYTPSENTEMVTKPVVALTGVEEAYEKIDSLVLKEWTNSEKVLQLNPEQTQLGFSFITVDLNHPAEIEYRTKLDAAEWSPWVRENKQNFAGLAYGAHSFSVQSRNNRWRESDPVRFRFFIDSPLYKKSWFQWSILVSAMLLLFVMGWSYILRLKAKNKAEQERLQTQNDLLTLEQKALQLQMNPHFVFNVLNGIKAMAGNTPDKMNATINSFATLLRETLQNSREQYISLEQEIKTLTHYITVEKLMSSKNFEYTITSRTEPNADEILIPPMLIQPFVENAIRHGILKGDRKGILEISFKTSKTYLECAIVDNGPGIFKSQNNKTKTDHQSMALKVTRERLESISGAHTLQISEIKSEDGTVKGTEIRFEVPLLTDY